MNPRFSVHTSDKTSPRGFSWIWFLRVVQLAVSLIVLGLSATNISGLTISACSVPGKMAWNLACAILALISLVYLLLSSGTARTTRILPWWIFIQLGLDALMFIFWIAAAGTSHFSCNDLCASCHYWGFGELTYDRLDCYCESSGYIFYEKRSMSPNPSLGLSGGVQKRRTNNSSTARRTGTLTAREALDAIMVVLFFITLCSTAWWMWQNRRAGSTTANTAPNPENGNNGVQQVPVEMKQDTPYTGTPAPQYSNVAPQQGNYGPISPVNGTQGQYPQYPQQPQQVYNQQQGYPQQQPYPQQQQQQQQGYPQQQQQQYPEPQQQQQPPQGQGYYGGPEREMSSPPPQQGIPDYPTPTPEMQAEHAVKQ